MKKSLLLLLTATLLSTLMGCQTPCEEMHPLKTEDTTEWVIEMEPETEAETEAATEAQTEVQTEPETEAQTDTQADTSAQYYPYRGYDDIYDYLHQMWEKKINQGGDVELNGQNAAMTSVLPIMKKEGFEPGILSSSNEGATVTWSFSSIGGDPFGSDDDVIVTVYPDAYWYNRVATELSIPNEHGACLWTRWYLLIGNHTVTVKLPESEKVHGNVPFEKVLEYLDFEIVTYSPTAETDAVQ